MDVGRFLAVESLPRGYPHLARSGSRLAWAFERKRAAETILTTFEPDCPAMAICLMRVLGIYLDCRGHIMRDAERN